MTLSLDAKELFVFVNGRRDKNLKVRQVEHTMGGSRLDSAEIFYDHALTGDLLEDCALFDEFDNREIEITNSRGVVLHWGKVAIVRPLLGPSYDLALMSRTEPHHFGEPIVGRMVYSTTANGVTIARRDRPLIFNPILDGKITPNKSGITGAGFFYFLDETSSYTEAALKFQKEPITDPKKLKPWRLQDCVRYLCGVANEEQEFIRNPDGRLLDREIEDSEGDLVKDFHIPDGIMLPQALDMLLTPFGYQWQVVYLAKGSRQIFVQKKGRGASVTVAYQPYGDLLDMDKTHAERIDLNFDAASKTASELTVYGGLGEVEATFELVRSWPEDQDDATEDKLMLDSEDYADDKALHRVWRDWVLNEAGDYIGVRPEHKKPYDLSKIFEEDDCIVRRRRFLPTLTVDDDGAPIGRTHGVTVEWYDSDGQWRSLDEISDGNANQVLLLERECGIRFSGIVPPWEIMAMGASAKVRITATLQCDRRLTRTQKVAGSQAQERIPVSIVTEAFQRRKIDKTSIYYDKVQSKELDSAEVDDTGKLQSFIYRLADSLDAAECSGSITLNGLDYSYQLGQEITRISGREINLVTAAGKYPLIVGIVYNVPAQTTTLILDAYRDAIEKQLNLSRRPRRMRELAHP